MKKIAKILLILLVIGLWTPFATLAKSPPTPFESTDTLVIRTAKADAPFRIEIADTEEKQERGLMFREALAEDAGMLFIWKEDKNISMWMKDTLIPLDMLFIDSKGKIIYIAQNTTPGSLEPVGPGKPVRAILEIGGGLAKKRHIRVGDRVKHHFFKS